MYEWERARGRGGGACRNGFNMSQSQPLRWLGSLKLIISSTFSSLMFRVLDSEQLDIFQKFWLIFSCTFSNRARSRQSILDLRSGWRPARGASSFASQPSYWMDTASEVLVLVGRRLFLLKWFLLFALWAALLYLWSFALPSSKCPLLNLAPKPWFLQLPILAKVNLRNLVKPFKTLWNYKLQNLAKCCKTLQINICENNWTESLQKPTKSCLQKLANLGISAQAYLRKLARVHAFCTCESLWKHNLQKPCKMLWKVYLC